MIGHTFSLHLRAVLADCILLKHVHSLDELFLTCIDGNVISNFWDSTLQVKFLSETVVVCLPQAGLHFLAQSFFKQGRSAAFIPHA